ncbi:MAG: ACP S-malonyltransferase [Acidobacteria bacterium]|nr:ACP S-malonyltransferase [Acidobacteriota bacterium]
MVPAGNKMSGPLQSTHFGDLQIPLICNVDAALVTVGDTAREALERQISAPVRWTESVQRLLDEGVRVFVEVGPGKVLIGLVRSIAKEAGIAVQLVHGEDLDGLREVFAN